MLTGRRLRYEIENAIATGDIAPGERLDEAQLARRFGVSRTPVREALIELSATGLVESRPHRGVVVAVPGPARLVEMFEVMAELEALCGRLVARRLTPATRTALIAAHAACAATVTDPDGYYVENAQFHTVIYEGSGNAFLADQAQALHRRLAPYRRLQLRHGTRLATSYAEHDAIVRAILAGNEDAAATALRGHVVVQGTRFTDLMAGLQFLMSA
jgi:DNA-binding GntR family transcriptional regulator